MKKQILASTMDVLQAILPIVIVITVLQFTLIKMPIEVFVQFLLGALFVIVGMTLFLVGVKIGVLPMGQAIGSELPKRSNLVYIIALAFIIGFSVTVAEPDVIALSQQVDIVSGNSISHFLLISVIAIGVGFFIVVAILRIVTSIPITYILAAGYALVLILSFFTPPQFIPVAFDAGGVTTGPITVPVILSLGIGFTSVLAGKSPIADGFGLIGLASLGPILGVMIMGMVLF